VVKIWKNCSNYLEEKGVCIAPNDRWHWAAESYPADEVSLRQLTRKMFVVVDTTEAGKHKVICGGGLGQCLYRCGMMKPFILLASEQYHVNKFDLEGKKAYVRKVNSDYYTDAMT